MHRRNQLRWALRLPMPNERYSCAVAKATICVTQVATVNIVNFEKRIDFLYGFIHRFRLPPWASLSNVLL